MCPQQKFTHSPNDIRVYYVNIRSIRNKIPELRNLIKSSDYDVYCFCETWLESDNSDLLSNLGFKTFRRDRGSRGGGLIILAKNEIFSKLLYSDEKLEILSISLTFGKKDIHIIVVYIPHPDNEILCKYWKILGNLLGYNGSTIVIGDFNVHWQLTKSIKHPDSENFRTMKIFFCKLQPLHQLVDSNTRKDRIIDLVFTRDNSLVKNLIVLDPFLSDHNPITFKISVQKNSRFSNVKYLKFINNSYNVINCNIQNSNILSTLKVATNAEAKWDIFNEFLLDSICKYSHPPRNEIFNKPFKFFDKLYIRLIKKKFKLWSLYKKTGHKIFYEKYITCKQNCVHRFTLLHKKFENNIFKLKTKKFYNYIRTSMSNKHIISTVINHQDIILNDDIQIANSFNEYFYSVFSKPKPHLQQGTPVISHILDFVGFTENEIRTVLKNLKYSSAVGPNGVPFKILKENIEFFTLVFYNLFNFFIKESFVPPLWKFAVITPILKKAPKSG